MVRGGSHAVLIRITIIVDLENNIFTYHLEETISLQDLKRFYSMFAFMMYLDDASTTMSDNQKRQLNNTLSARVQTNGILLRYNVYVKKGWFKIYY